MKKFTSLSYIKKKRRGEKISMMTSYDATFARIVDGSGVDGVLVGDSMGNVIQGHDNTLPVTIDHVIYHTRAVARAVDRVHVVADMPFGSYQASLEIGMDNAFRLIKEGGAEAVKVEGGERVTEMVRRLVDAGVPVMGHLGLTPQSVHALGGYRVQGRDDDDATRLARDARALQDAGVFALVLEMVPATLANQITADLAIPTIGIGAGPGCDGQILVIYDFLGMDDRFCPKFLKKYRHYAKDIGLALDEYVEDVRAGRFPGEDHSF